MKAIVATFCLAVAACGCGGSSQAGGDAGGDASAPDLGVILTGTQLLAGDVAVAGITSDDVVAVVDSSRGALAVPAAGGDAQLVDAASDGATAMGPVIFSMRRFDAVSGFGDLTVWTAAFGAVPFTTDATLILAVSDDGTRVLATQGSSSDGTATNLVVGGVDGSPPVTVAPAPRLGGCSPRVGFGGGRFIASHCPLGSETVTISSVDPVTGATVDLLTPARNYFVTVPGSAGLVMVVGDDGIGYVVPAAGGARTVVGPVDAAVATLDGSALLVRSQGTLRRYPIDGSGPIPLIGAGVAALRAVSDDGTQLLYRSTLATRNGYGDLLLAPTTAGAAPLVVSASLDSAIFGSAFTADSSRVLYITQANDLFVGVLQSQPVGGGSPTVHGSDVWTAQAYADTRIVFNDQYLPVPKREGRAVLRAVDTAAGAEPTILATHAGAQFALTRARDRVVFSFEDGAGRAGLYVTPLP